SRCVRAVGGPRRDAAGGRVVVRGVPRQPRSPADRARSGGAAMTLEVVFPWIVTAIAAGPAASFLLLALIWFFGPTPGERLVRAVVITGNVISLGSAITVGALVVLGLHPTGTVRL